LEQTLDYVFLKHFLLDLAETIIYHRDYLNEIDAACGDGDFGVGMYLGFKNVQKAIEQQRNEDIGALLDTAGKAILFSVGGASGPIFGTFFIEAGKKVSGKSEIDLKDLSEMLEIALEKTRARGGAIIGDKTLIDALSPAIDSLKKAVQQKLGILTALEKAAEAAKKGSEATKDLVARQGKARYLGQQALGHVDPGAEVIRLFFEKLLSFYEFSFPKEKGH
jgi:dihydroxyacetone kinase-like protein